MVETMNMFSKPETFPEEWSAEEITDELCRRGYFNNLNKITIPHVERNNFDHAMKLTALNLIEKFIRKKLNNNVNSPIVIVEEAEDEIERARRGI